MKNLSDHIGNRTRDLITCSAVIEVSALLGVNVSSIGSQLHTFQCIPSPPNKRNLDWWFPEGWGDRKEMSFKKNSR